MTENPFELISAPLPPYEVSLSVKKVIRKNDKLYVLCLLHKTSRADMYILDQAFSPAGWSSEIELIDKEVGNKITTYYCRCTLTIKTNGEVVKRSDMGEGNSLKAAASDAFKRACFQLGIGRHLYYMPQIWLTFDANISDKEIPFLVASLKVDYEYDGDNLLKLEISDKKGNVLYRYK